jgi:hypothetical protein
MTNLWFEGCQGDGTMNLHRPPVITIGLVRLFLGVVAALPAVASPVASQTSPQITVEHLLTDGWEITGYTASSALSVSFILFKHKDHHFLMQCSVLYDATRSQRVAERVVTNCYEVR